MACRVQDKTINDALELLVIEGLEGIRTEIRTETPIFPRTETPIFLRTETPIFLTDQEEPRHPSF